MNITLHPLLCVALTMSINVMVGSESQAVEPKSNRHPIVIDGKFDDWKNVAARVMDPADDVIDTDGRTKENKAVARDHEDVDILEFKVTHDGENLYSYIRTKGVIGRTQRTDNKPDEKGVIEGAGRYYITVAIDVDDNDKTGYWLHEGGTYPTSPGYDMNVEIEWYNGEFNTAMYMNKCCLNEAELLENYLSLSQGQFKKGNDGPYPAGYHTIKEGQYDHYPEWVYHEDGTLTFVRDSGPVVLGVATGELSEDGHELEMKHPFVGFLKDQNGEAIAKIGKTFDICLNIQASGELSKTGKWAGDGAEPIEDYKLD
ncbi:MAG: hypothetical protein CMJ46_04715 [Planctomyces sp.]|nr:hypothetical protein [Planctomyces sp.]